MSGKPLPPSLPPETRTVGQLVAEAIRLYGNHFWRVLPLGLALALYDQVALGQNVATRALILAVFAPLLTAAYAGACLISHKTPLEGGRLARAFLAGTLAFLPAAFLMRFFILPAVAWLALVGLVVPVILYENLAVGAGFARAIKLARADYVHALGSLATLVIVYALTGLVLVELLHSTADSAVRIAAFLADVVISPVILVGAALLYFDQAARSSSIA